MAIVLHDHQAVVDHRRAAGTPLLVLVVDVAEVQVSEVLGPQRRAGHVEGIEPFRAHHRDDVRAVGCRRRRCLRRLRVALRLRHPLVGGALPEHAAGRPIEAVEPPRVPRMVGDASDLLQGDGAVGVDAGVAAGAGERHGAGHEDAVAPDDRARMAEARDRRLPGDVRAGGDVPGQRRLAGGFDAAGVRAAERGPALGRRGRTAEPARRREQDGGDGIGDRGMRIAWRPRWSAGTAASASESGRTPRPPGRTAHLARANAGRTLPMFSRCSPDVAPDGPPGGA